MKLMIFHQGKRPWILGSRIPNQMADGIAKIDLHKGLKYMESWGHFFILTLIHSKVGYIYIYLSLLPSPRFMTCFLPIFCFGGSWKQVNVSNSLRAVWFGHRESLGEESLRFHPKKMGDPFLLEQRVFLFTQHEGSSNLDVPYHVTKIFGSWEFL